MPSQLRLSCTRPAADAIARRREAANQLALGLFRKRVEPHLLAVAVEGRVEISGALRLIGQPTKQVQNLTAVVLARLVYPVVVQIRRAPHGRASRPPRAHL